MKNYSMTRIFRHLLFFGIFLINACAGLQKTQPTEVYNRTPDQISAHAIIAKYGGQVEATVVGEDTLGNHWSVFYTGPVQHTQTEIKGEASAGMTIDHFNFTTPQKYKGGWKLVLVKYTFADSSMVNQTTAFAGVGDLSSATSSVSHGVDIFDWAIVPVSVQKDDILMFVLGEVSSEKHTTQGVLPMLYCLASPRAYVEPVQEPEYTPKHNDWNVGPK